MDELNKALLNQLSIFFSYAKSVGATHFHTSAKLNKGIDELFLHLTKSKSFFVKLARSYYPHLAFSKQADNNNFHLIKM